MTQNPNEQKTCNECQQKFNSDRELQEHQKNAHQHQRPSGSQQEPGNEQKRDKIA